MRMASPKVTNVIRYTPLIAAVLLVLLALSSGYITLFKSSPSDDPTSVEEDLDHQITDYHKTHYYPVPFARIIMEVQAANPKERTVSATIQAHYYDSSLQPGSPELVDSKDRVIDPLDPQFAKTALTLTLLCIPEQEVIIRLPLSGLQRVPGQYAEVNIPVDASPQSFPHDKYNLHILDAILTTPKGMWLRYHYKTVKGEQIGHTTGWPIGFGIAQGNRLVDWRLKPAFATSASNTIYGNGVDVSSQLGRPISLILFVYSIALTPALLGLSYSVRAARRKRGEDDGISPFELGAAFIALLALRQVLIPSDIPGITLLDRILGIEIVILVAIAIAVSTLSRHSRPLGAAVEPHSQPEKAGANSRHPAIIMLVFAAALWRWSKRLRR